MELGKIVQSLFKTVKAILPDAVKTVTYHHKSGQPTYDYVTGTYTGGTVDHVLTDVILLGYRDTEVDGSAVRMGDVKMLVPVESVTFQATEEDRVTISGGKLAGDWEVHGFKLDPTQTALYTVRLRRP